MVRHREPRAAARSRQPAAHLGGPAAPRHVLAALEVTLPARSRDGHSATPHVASTAWLIELAFPSRCVSCGVSAQVLCVRCRASLRAVGPVLCARCGAPTAWPVERCRECAGRRVAFASARAAVTYTGAARRVVSAWKEHGLRRAASLAADLVAERVPRPAADVIAYIPPDPGRMLTRGHHPAEHLARELAERWAYDVLPLLERRDGHARRQVDLGREERARNVRGAFAAARAAPRTVVLVDDVYTTGATVSAAATELRRAGARRVDVVTFARTVRA